MSENESNLIIWFPSDFGGCGHLRSLWINESLNSYFGSKKKYEGMTSSRFIVDKNILIYAKAFHFQRQITKNQLDYIKFVIKFRDDNLKGKNVPVIYDCDDRFFDIPDFNYAKQFFNTEELKKNFIEIVNIVDIITVSTDEMADWIKSLNGKSKIKVVPNFVPKYVYRPYDFVKKQNEKPRVIWAGSANHYSESNMGDFSVIYDLIVNTINDFDWTLVGIRNIPKWLNNVANKITTATWSPIVGFPNKLKSLNGDFGIAPLIPDIFNEAKSNIKLLDYWSADLVTITSRMKPYEKENELFFTGDWKLDRDLILNIFNNKETMQSFIQKQHKTLNKYWLEDNLKIYMDLFNLKY